MRILSKPDFMVAVLPNGVWHKWTKGSHTVNVWHGGFDIDCYTFAWHKNNASMLDFTSALQRYLED